MQAYQVSLDHGHELAELDLATLVIVDLFELLVNLVFGVVEAKSLDDITKLCLVEVFWLDRPTGLVLVEHIECLLEDGALLLVQHEGVVLAFLFFEAFLVFVVAFLLAFAFLRQLLLQTHRR